MPLKRTSIIGQGYNNLVNSIRRKDRALGKYSTNPKRTKKKRKIRNRRTSEARKNLEQSGSMVKESDSA